VRLGKLTLQRERLSLRRCRFDRAALFSAAHIQVAVIGCVSRIGSDRVLNQAHGHIQLADLLRHHAEIVQRIGVIGSFSRILR